ncbi:hypothetical protein HGRIS_005698 [Hohenbuehelia grisea]|uniref:Uncharacterized protein n=1 Tax=Hohenbuehelia grisea TaxID=104357 RepID=A0ABR3JYI1_9AGAR
MRQQEVAYKEATGQSLTSIPTFIARGIIALNPQIRALISHMEKMHSVVVDGKDPGLGERIGLSRRACVGGEMLTLKAWAGRNQGQGKRDQGWNQVSIWKLLTGKQ